jgi:hypothetical protein
MQPAQPVDMTAAAAHQVPEFGVAGRGIELLVEVVIGSHEFLELPGLGEFLLQRDSAIQLVNQLFGVIERQRLDDFQLERLAQEMRLLRQANVDPADDGGVLRKDFDQPLFREALPVFGYRR